MTIDDWERMIRLALSVVALASLVGWPMLVIRLRKEFATKEQIMSPKELEVMIDKSVSAARTGIETTVGAMGSTAMMQHAEQLKQLDRIAKDMEKALEKASEARDLSKEAKMIAESCERDRELVKDLMGKILDSLAKRAA